MSVSEAPGEIRSEISTQENNAYDVTMSWDNQKKAYIVGSLLKLSNHLDSINEFEVSDSLDSIAKSILKK